MESKMHRIDREQESIVLALALGVLLTGSAARLHAEPDSWAIETIAAVHPGTMFLNSSIALDDTNVPHVAYVHGGMLIYSCKIGILWDAEVVDEVPAPPPAPSCETTWSDKVPTTAIAVHGNEVHIAYSLGSSGPPLRYARRTAGLWFTEPVDERASSSTERLSLVLDAHGKPMISYCGYPSCDGCPCSLKIAYRVQEQWTTELVETGATTRVTTSGARSTLRLQGDRSYVLVSTDLRGPTYLRKTAAWAVEPVSANGTGAASLALDSAERPWVAWLESQTLRLAHRQESGTWNAENRVDSIDADFNAVALEVDANNDVHIVFGTQEALKYAIRHEAGNWQVETIDEHGAGIVPLYQVSLTLDDLDRPHISYVRIDELNRKSLMYAFRR